MPELPEVETVRAGLAAHVLGREVADAVVLRDRAVRRQAGGAQAFAALLRRRRITSVVRRGKFCWLLLTGPDGELEDYALLAHLGMSGQVLVRDQPGADPLHLRVRLSLADGGEIWFVDQRTFGYLSVENLVPTLDGGPGGHSGTGPNPALLPQSVAHIGRDLLDPLVAAGTPGRTAINRRLRRGRREIKRALLDQTLASGIGNIYADEALWRARVHYRRRTDVMRAGVVEEVLDAATAVMGEALAAGGTSFDALYVNVNGASGYFDRSLAVYGQAGRPCPRCDTAIVRESFTNRSSHFCPKCQRFRRSSP